MKQKTIETPFATIMVPVAAISHLKAITDPAKLVDTMTAFLPMTGGAKQRILELPNPLHRRPRRCADGPRQATVSTLNFRGAKKDRETRRSRLGPESLCYTLKKPVPCTRKPRR
jgi:hypothetical protein